MVTELMGELATTVVMAAWIVYAVLFLRRPRAAVVVRDSRSLVGVAVQFSAIAVLWFFRRPSLSEPGAIVDTVLSLLAMLLAIGGVWLSRSSIRQLGENWSLPAQIHEGHQLVTTGPYATVRHPLHLGYLMMLLSAGAIMRSWEVLLAAIAISLIGIRIRTVIEERLLRQAFGVLFEEYVRRVPALIPRLFHGMDR